MKRNDKKEFWLINKSVSRDVSLGDLRITVKRGAHINLLSKNYSFTEQQLEDSRKSGSIFKKRHLLAVREVQPRKIITPQVKEVVKPRVLTPLRNPQISTAVPYIKELDFDNDMLGMSDEQFAAEQADADSMDRKPALAVDKKYQGTKDLDDLIDE